MAIIIIRNQNFVNPVFSENVLLQSSHSEEMFPQQVVTPVKTTKNEASTSRAHRRPKDYKVTQYCIMQKKQNKCFRICGGRPLSNKFYFYGWRRRTRELLVDISLMLSNFALLWQESFFRARRTTCGASLETWLQQLSFKQRVYTTNLGRWSEFFAN